MLLIFLKWKVNNSIILFADTESENRFWDYDWICITYFFPCTEKYSIEDKQFKFQDIVQVAIEYALKDCNPSSETASQ